MGELEFARKGLVEAVERGLVEQAREAAELRLSTLGGRFQVCWDEGGSASALGQLAFFAEFLEVTGVSRPPGPSRNRMDVEGYAILPPLSRPPFSRPGRFNSAGEPRQRPQQSV